MKQVWLHNRLKWECWDMVTEQRGTNSGRWEKTDWKLQPLPMFKVNWSTSDQLITLEIVSSKKPNLRQETMHSLMHLLAPFHKITPVLLQSSRVEQDKNTWQGSGLQLVQNTWSWETNCHWEVIVMIYLKPDVHSSWPPRNKTKQLWLSISVVLFTITINM